jgi:hypothetical protein
VEELDPIIALVLPTARYAFPPDSKLPLSSLKFF